MRNDAESFMGGAGTAPIGSGRARVLVWPDIIIKAARAGVNVKHKDPFYCRRVAGESSSARNRRRDE